MISTASSRRNNDWIVKTKESLGGKLKAAEEGEGNASLRQSLP